MRAYLRANLELAAGEKKLCILGTPICVCEREEEEEEKEEEEGISMSGVRDRKRMTKHIHTNTNTHTLTSAVSPEFVLVFLRDCNAAREKHFCPLLPSASAPSSSVSDLWLTTLHMRRARLRIYLCVFVNY